jgi:hypothetical protein
MTVKRLLHISISFERNLKMFKHGLYSHTNIFLLLKQHLGSSEYDKDVAEGSGE